MSRSLWADTLPAELVEYRPSLPGDTDADVVIVGAGYTGLWSAYALLGADPTLRVVVLEREHVGFGASGRNGGWCSGFFAGPRAITAKEHGRDAVVAMQRAMFDTVDEIGRVVRVEGIDCDWAKGGSIDVATIRPHVTRLQQMLEDHRSWGFGDDDWRWLEPDESGKVIGCTPNLGAMYTPHCATIHPAKLAHGLARAVERRGATIYEHSAALEISPGVVKTEHGIVRAPVIVRATEAFTPSLPGLKRALVPIYSLMIATEPLPDAFWADAHLDERPTWTDARTMVIYGQRTADGRLAFGGRGAPYHFGSKTSPAYDTDESVFASLHETLRSLFPALGDAAITHRWGGAVAVPRDWYPSVNFDRASGIAVAGGYVGDGVATTNLAGRTVADLVLGRDTDLTHLPWVGHRSPDWEPEPLRWLGIRAFASIVERSDRAEEEGRPPGRSVKLLSRLR